MECTGTKIPGKGHPAQPPLDLNPTASAEGVDAHRDSESLQEWDDSEGSCGVSRTSSTCIKSHTGQEDMLENTATTDSEDILDMPIVWRGHAQPFESEEEQSAPFASPKRRVILGD